MWLIGKIDMKHCALYLINRFISQGLIAFATRFSLFSYVLLKREAFTGQRGNSHQEMGSTVY